MQRIFYLLPGLFLSLLTTGTLTAQCVSISQGSDSLIVCQNASVLLAGIGGSDYQWSPEADFDDPTADTVVLTPSQSQWYYLTGMIGDSTCTDSLYVLIPEFSVAVSTMDTVCPLDIVTVSFHANAQIDSVSWSTMVGVDDPASTTGTTIAPLVTSEYILSAYINGCEVPDTFEIDVVVFRFELVTMDTLFLCLDDSIAIRHALLPSGAEVSWTPFDSTINVVSPITAFVKPTVSTTFTATATFEDCVLSTTTFIRVDSLPDTLLTIIPLRDPYCAGERITIFAERADTLKYPDIEFQWYPIDGQIQDSTNTGNVYVVLQDTTTFFRVMTNNACIDTSQVMVNVIPPDIPLSVTDTTLCPGDMFVVEILDPDVEDVEWSPAEGLSCTSCLNPTVTVPAHDQLYTVEAKKDRCSVSGMLSVHIFPEYQIPVTPQFAQACPGDQIAFMIDTTGLTNLSIEVSGAGSLSCNDCPDPVLTYNGGEVLLILRADEDFEMNCGAGNIITILMKPDQEVQLGATPVCAGEPTVIPLDQFGSFINPSLSINNGSISCTECLDPEVTIDQTTALIITSDSPDTNTCLLKSTLVLLVPEDDEVEFDLSSPPPYGQGEVVGIELITTPSAPAGTTYQWTINGILQPETTSSVNAPLNEVENMIHVLWTNSHGCIQEADTLITTVPPFYRIPKAFTPGRELNTNFRVEIVGNLEIVEMLVFNRWGQVVYEGTDEDGWNGRREGEVAPPEVYTYVIKLRNPNGQIILEKGDVTLIR